MKIILAVLMFVFISGVFSGCMKSELAEQHRQEIYFDDNNGSDTNDKNEVVLDDRQLLSEKLNKKSAPEPEHKIGEDGSNITVTGDAHGNKTESRCFADSPRLKCVVIETAADGNVEITVYGRNGVIKNVAPEKVADILNMEAEEIANAAELFEPSQKADITKLIPSKNRPKDLSPMPSSEFPVFPNQMPPVAEEQLVEEPQPVTEENAPTETDNQESSDMKN